MKNIINFVLFQMLWLSCVLGAANDMLWPASIVLTVMLFIFLRTELSHADDLKLLISSVAIGFLLDSLLAYFDLIIYNYNLGYSQMAPFWIVYLWAGFALTLNHSMSWILKNKHMGYAFIAIGAPLSYFSAHKLNAIVINQIPLTLLVTSVLWLSAFYLILLIQKTEFSSEKLRHV